MRPLFRLGAESPFGLALPSAKPTAAQLYAPRGVWLDDERLIVADSGNHRLLVWNSVPCDDGAPADVVLGQPDFEREGANAGGTSIERGLHLPTGVAVIDGRLVVADAWHHRVLVWHSVPTTSFAPADVVIGQSSLLDVEPNRGGEVSASSLYWPYGVGAACGWFWITDTGNRRVLGWPSVPLAGEPAQVILGQPGPTENSENRGGEVRADSFRWPHAVAGDGDHLYIADAGNHRVVGWDTRPDRDLPATLVLGQRDFTSNEELPHRKQGAHRLRFPYAVAAGESRVVVADTANNRVLLYSSLPDIGAQYAADGIIGQLDFDSAGENRWNAVTPDTLCWPYGISLHGDRLAIADSGNNRVVIWTLAPDESLTSIVNSGTVEHAVSSTNS